MDGLFVRSVLVQFASFMPLHAVRPMVSYRALELGASAAQLGLVAACYAALSLVASIPVGRLADRIGEAWCLVAGSALLVLSTLLCAWASSIAVLCVSQALLGLAQIVVLIGLQAQVANGARPGERLRRFGVLTVSGSLGQAVGPVAGGYVYSLTHDSINSVFYVFCFVMALSAGLSLTFLFGERNAKPRRPSGAAPRPSVVASIQTIFSRPSIPHVMVASLTVLAALDLITAYLPAYGEAVGLSVGTVSALLSVRAVASIVSRSAMIPLARMGRRLLLTLALGLAALGLLLVPSTANVFLLVILMAVAGLGLGLGQPVSLTWVADEIPAEVRATGIALRLTGNRMGQLLIPLAMGLVAGATGVGAIFVATAALLGLSGFAVARAPTGGELRRQDPTTAPQE